MAKWNIGTESGILRKKVVKDKHEDLLVFGYACKLFRDDEKALYIDQGKHLIPWMGNDALKIDRYDCRGALSELSPYEATGEDYDQKRWLNLDERDRKTEMLCDEERYYSLKNNEEELEMYQEEELKRLHQKGSEVHYNYDVPTDPDSVPETKDTVEEEDQIFVPSSQLNLPADITVPKTVKENTRIEKTANFVSQQGLQMEILIKTKQADNPQFSFMNKDDLLFPYYKHLLQVIKSGEYKVQSSSADEEQKQEDSFEHDEQGDYYLHPSLQATALQSAPPPLPTVIYKPSPDCTYFQLVNRIQGVQSESATPPPPPTQPPQADMTYEQQQQYYQQFYYSAQYYEYYKQMAQFSETNQDQTKTKQDEPCNSSNQSNVQNQAAYAQYFQSSTNPYAQIVSNLSINKDTATTPYPNISESEPHNEISKAPILYNQNDVALNVEPQLPQTPTKTETPVVKSILDKPALPLVAYDSDSETEYKTDDEEENDVVYPPSEMRLVIETMANYVSKNGRDFINIVKSKGDSRFEFLNENNKYHPYYQKKIREYSSQLNSSSAPSAVTKEQQNGIGTKLKEKKVIAPVSFSIKKVKEDIPKDIKSALPVEESDEDQEENVQTTKSSSVVSSTPSIITTVTQPTSNSPAKEVVASSTLPTVTPLKNVAEEKIQNSQQENCDQKKGKIETDDLILDLIDLTDDMEEKKDSKRAEYCRRDKIVTEAKEKLALQLERKRKAAAFLKLKSSGSSLKEEKVEKRRSHKRKSGEEVEKDSRSRREKHSKTKDKYESDVLKVEDSESEEGEIKKPKKSSKKKKSHKRKRSRSRHESRSRQRSKDHKKSKKRHKRDYSSSSKTSTNSQ